MTMLSLFAHGDGDVEVASKIIDAARAVAQRERNEGRQALYWGLIEHALRSTKHEAGERAYRERNFRPHYFGPDRGNMPSTLARSLSRNYKRHQKDRFPTP